jgi:hypothetical protein
MRRVTPELKWVMRNNGMIEKLRAQIIGLDSKLDAERMPDTKRLRFALSDLDAYDKTGSAVFLQAATDKYNEIARAVGDRPPEDLEEMPR